MNGYYQVSNLGNVRSLDRIVKDTTKNRTQKLKGIILKYCDNGRGYKIVFLNKDRKRKNFYVHRLVAEAFIPNPYNLEEINHKDLDKSNNAITNLEWVTELENKRHYQNTEIAKKNNKLKGQRNKEKYRKQIEKQIPDIIRMYQIEDATIEEINQKTGIGDSYISRILKEKNILIRNKKRQCFVKRDKFGRFAKKELKNEKK